jgi:hypothetical protein
MTGIGNKGRAFNMAMHHANIDALTFWRFIHAWVNNEFARVMLKVVAANRPVASVMNFDSSQRSHRARYVVLSTVVVLKHEELDMVVKASHRLGVRPVIKDASKAGHQAYMILHIHRRSEGQVWGDTAGMLDGLYLLQFDSMTVAEAIGTIRGDTDRSSRQPSLRTQLLVR